MCATLRLRSLLPDAVAGPTVSPATLHLPEARNAALLSSQTTARPINKLHMRFGVNGEVQKQADHLSVCQYA